MSELLGWISSQEQAEPYLPNKLTRVQHEDGVPQIGKIKVPDFWKSISVNKLLTLKFPDTYGPNLDLKPAQSSVLGGMCLLTTIDMKDMYNKDRTFDSLKDFEKWYASWYPRIDQIHDTVGIPPKVCPKVNYVSEDSFFAGRIASYTGLDKDGVQSVLRETHEQQGHPVVEKYLRTNGYKGEIGVTFTSDIEEELDLALRVWERILGKKFRTADRSFAKVEVMYTGMWLDVLKIPTSGIIYEAANKMVLKGYLKIDDWFRDQKYGTGMNTNLGIAGFMPFMTSQGDSAVLSYDDVPNIGNHKEFIVPKEESAWYVANLLSAKRTVVEHGPTVLSYNQAQEMINADLCQYFDI